ncbi:conserved hypothetical protein [Histoplasma capsulatum G186AR]|uniref:Pentatricopeptide repeat protein n=2 Tax=Ajellomyces capsulatus TaxID=5037 RepID=C0NDV0_AJECG|nr:uncharacterized protein HCBG_02043 [Histoplasma capsulatum G186AR]EEH10398.1 conserved hypothetical protein [Histoplasma capsulatum G186AR]KAG5290623.1 squalene epoxidase [Histoplasma capsulatum]QSS72551.1 squalene epoxidase [Histoplasma capsulatum G186AR]
MFPRQSARTGVPSRNALRVLRQLALAGSAIGAIGGFCAVGTITYDLHRRVRFAERIVESKRSLQTSCPNYNAGTGAATVAQMMEAAEAGEFLGLASFKKRSERQRHQLANSPEANMDRADGANPRESHTTGVSDNSIGVANESFEAAGQTPREALKPPVRSSAISQPQGIAQVPPQPSFFLNKYKPKLKSRKEVRTDLAYPMSVPPEFREKYQDLPPNDPSLAVQRLLDHHMLDEATLRFLRDANATSKANEEARNDIAVHLLYTSLHRNRIHLAQKLFYWFEANQKLTPPLWEIMLLAMWKNGRFESLATLYLKYAKEFELTPVLLRVVLKSLISSHRLSEAKTVLFKYVGNDTDCGACGIYLGGLWSRTRSIVLMETQFRKLLDTLASCRISPTEKLFDPLLGAYVEFGMSDKADMLVKTMQDTYNIPLKTRTLGLVAYGKAVNCDWDGVRNTLARMHELGLSAKDPFRFTQMFHRVFLEFWIANSGNAIHQFVFDAINTYGLVPDKLLFDQIIKAIIQKGTVEMVEEILQTVKEKGWKLKLERPYFMELLQEARLSAKCSPTGLWRMFRATEQKYGYAATSRQVLGYDATSFPLNESEKKPNSQETAAMWRRAMSMPESSRHIRQFTPLHTQMMYFINAGKPELSLTSFQDAKKSGMVMKHLHLDLAVTASILLHGDTRDAKTILQEFETLQLPSKPVTSQFFQAVMQASEMGEIEAVKMAVLNFYNIRQQKLLPVKHHAASTVAARLLDIGNNAAVLDMFRAINQSKYTAFAPFDPVAIKFIARAFYRSGNFKGVRWAIFTGLKRPSAVNRDLCDEISFIVSRSKNIYPLPSNYTRESFNREMAHISKLARILRHTFKARKFGPDRFISFPEAIEMLKGQARTPGSNTGSGNGLEKGPQLKGYKFEDLRYTDYIVRNWKERAELEKCFSPDAAEERDWSESGVFADGAEDPFEEPTMEESARLRVV